MHVKNDQLNLLSDYYDDLLEAASQVHDLVKPDIEYTKSKYDNTKCICISGKRR